MEVIEPTDLEATVPPWPLRDGRRGQKIQWPMEEEPSNVASGVANQMEREMTGPRGSDSVFIGYFVSLGSKCEYLLNCSK